MLSIARISKTMRHAHDHGPFHARHLVRVTRSFLRYLYYKGLVDSDLSLAVPKVARWRLSTLPKYLPAAHVRQYCGIVIGRQHWVGAIRPSYCCWPGSVCEPVKW